MIVAVVPTCWSDPAKLLNNILLCGGLCQLGAHAVSNAMVYLLMDGAYPGPYSRSPLAKFYAEP